MANSEYMRDLIARRTLLDADAFPEGLWVSLHTADPGGQGNDELAGFGYRRQPVTLGLAAVGTVTNANEMRFRDLPASVVTHFGLWNSETDGDFVLGGPWDTPQQSLAHQSLFIENTFFVVRFVA